MSIRKRNEFLDGDDSDEELGNASGSDVEESRAAIGGRASKRRKTDDSESSDAENDDEVEKEEPLKPVSNKEDDRFDFSKFDEDDDEDGFGQDHEDEDEETERTDHDRIPGGKSSAARQAEKAQKAVRKSGVIYISRVPPFMKPQTLRHFLEPHARKGIGRIFLTPEDHVAHTKRVKSGGNKKKSFTDGWVEFNSKTEAKLAAETLNGNIIGGKKGNFYHDDLWSIKYLKGFKWQHLTEQIANENAERAARITAEIRKSRKENKAFAEDVERAKMLEGMEIKKKAKRARAGEDPEVAGETIRPAREFKQRKVQSNRVKTGGKPSADAGRALSKLHSSLSSYGGVRNTVLEIIFH